MIDFDALETKKARIRQMSLRELFRNGEKLYYTILIHKAEERSKDFWDEFESDCLFIDECKLSQINLTIFNILVYTHTFDNNCIKDLLVYTHTFDNNCIKDFKNDFNKISHDFCLYNEYIDKALCSYFLQNLNKNDRFCKEVVTLYLSKHSENNGEIEEVKKWLDLHNSQEFKKSIAQDVLSISYYKIVVEEMIDDYVKYRVSLGE